MSDAANGKAGREKILDAAEEQFSQRGYHGASLREIAAVAQVSLALLRYHFGSKDDLFREATLRRAEALAARMNAELDRVEREAGEGLPELEDLVRAICTPSFDLILEGGERWHNYLRLLSQFSSIDDRDALVRPYRTHYAPHFKRTVDAFQRALPGAQSDDIFWAIYFCNLILGQLQTERRLPGSTSTGHLSPAARRKLMDRVVRYATAGIAGLAAAGPSPPKRVQPAGSKAPEKPKSRLQKARGY